MSCIELREARAVTPLRSPDERRRRHIRRAARGGGERHEGREEEEPPISTISTRSEDPVRVAARAARVDSCRAGVHLVVGTGVDPVTSRFSGARSAN